MTSLPLLFIAVQSIFASLVVPVASVLSPWINERYGVVAAHYAMEVAGSLISAFCILFPIGYFGSGSKLLIGFVIGTVTAIELIFIAKAFRSEYVFLILFCEMAAIVGSKARRSDGSN